MAATLSPGASAYIDALGRAGVTHFVTVPDFVQLALHQAIEGGQRAMRLVRTCNEDQAVSVAAGLTIAGKRPVVAIQNQGSMRASTPCAPWRWTHASRPYS